MNRACRFGTIITSQLNLMEAYVDDLLNLTQMRMGVFSFVKDEFNPQEAINFVKTMFAYKAEAKEIRIIQRKRPDMPVKLMGDERRFKQVLINLVKNSIKFTSDGYIEIEAEYNSFR